MYYTWNWWWLLSWMIPMLLLLWIVFGWNSRRYWGPREDYSRQREDWADDRPRRDPRRSGKRGLGPRNYVRQDARIQEDVCDSLMMDDQLDASAIEVEVLDGRVSLRGVVATRLDKRLAEALADGVPGVKDVDNRLQVGELTTTASQQTHQPSAPSQPAHGA